MFECTNDCKKMIVAFNIFSDVQLHTTKVELLLYCIYFTILFKKKNYMKYSFVYNFNFTYVM